jgi:hypothetical protein
LPSVLPETDVYRVRRWAERRVPPEVKEKIRVEVDTTPTSITIVECRPPWGFAGSSEWTRNPIARMRYTRSRREWSLYWSDRNGKFHLYDLVMPTEAVEELLAEIDDDPTCIFWG